MKKSRPASKAFLKALATSRAEPKATELPDKIRAFGIELSRSVRRLEARPHYSGGEPGRHIVLWQDGSNRWQIQIQLGAQWVMPDLPSSSPAAAIRNLRGHLLNLELSIGKLFKRKKP